MSISIETSKDLVRAVRYALLGKPFDKDTAVLYLTILKREHSGEEQREPFPFWVHGLPNIQTYLRFFKSKDLIYKVGNSYSIPDSFRVNDFEYSINDPYTIDLILRASPDVIELNGYFTAS